MEFSGLIVKYRANRPLTERERLLQLRQQQRLNVEPHYELSVVKLNSTYLESVDKWFAWKGTITAFAMIVFAMFVGTLGAISISWFLEAVGGASAPKESGYWFANSVAMATLAGLIGWGMVWLLRKESFAYTHYPMRFNRKTRMVHVFRTNGTILSVPWDDVFFTMEHMAQWDEWEVRGHVLEPDSTTVRESFALSYLGSLSPSDAQPNRTQFSAQDFVHAHWEFIRRYMEDGPQSVSGQVQFCMPVDTQRESMQISVQRLFANITGAPIVLFLMLLPFCLVISLFRLFAMRTSRVPHWPTEIDAVCAIEPNDPYAIEGNASADRVAVFPEAAKAAGVGFVAPPGAMACDLRQGLAKKGSDNGAAKRKVK